MTVSIAHVDTRHHHATPPQRTYEFTRWGGGRQTVVADRIEFGPEHVVFKLHGELVIAVKNANVNDLHPTTTGSENPA